VIGAALQYNHIGNSSEWLLEASLDSWDSSVTENDVRLGKVAKYVTGFTATGLFGDKLNRKLTLDLKYNLNYWIPSLSTRPVANNSIIDGNINYTVYTGAYESGFNWVLGLGMDMAMLRLKRINPVSKLTSNNVLPYAFLGKDISISKEHSLLARLKLGYNFSAGNEFNYGGDSAEGNYIVNYMLDDEMDYLSSYYLSTTLNLDYTYRMNDRLSAYASLSSGLLSPMDRNTSRFILQLSVGTLF